MTAARWDDLPADWSVTTASVQPDACTTDGEPIRTGAGDLMRLIQADVIWRKLTKPQREVLLSAAADAPIAARADVRARLVSRRLINDDLTLTEAGRLLVAWRPR